MKSHRQQKSVLLVQRHRPSGTNRHDNRRAIREMNRIRRTHGVHSAARRPSSLRDGRKLRRPQAAQSRFVAGNGAGVPPARGLGKSPSRHPRTVRPQPLDCRPSKICSAKTYRTSRRPPIRVARLRMGRGLARVFSKSRAHVYIAQTS